MTGKAGYFAVLDLVLARIVNDADCWLPSFTLGRPRKGAIAQLGERVVRNDEVGGSIPPGSTSLRRLHLLRLGEPYRGKAAASKPAGRRRPRHVTHFHANLILANLSREAF